MSSGPQIRVGVGGWVYAPWRGVFYPPGLPQAQELAYASRQVTTIEINGTFYGRQKPESFRRWHEETPEDFVFSLKGPRFVTHRDDLATAGTALDRFFASGVLELRDKLGPILWQFPPTKAIDEGALAAFAELLPRRLDGRALRHVIEVRGKSRASASRGKADQPGALKTGEARRRTRKSAEKLDLSDSATKQEHQQK